MIDKIYHWMLFNLPNRIMYKKIWFDSHQIWVPRLGWSKKQISDSEKWANEAEKLKWE